MSNGIPTDPVQALLAQTSLQRNLLLFQSPGNWATTDMTDVLVKLQSEGPGRIPYLRCPFLK
jgi:hypothetical protein